MTTTGVLMRYLLPPGSGHSSTIWGLDRHEWGGVHFWISLVFFGILALHLLLHWRWIVTVLAGRPRQGSGLRVGLGIVGLTAVIALGVAPLLTPVELDPTRSEGLLLSSHRYEQISIRGSMTLREVEVTTGVPAAYIIESLELPDSVSPDDKLGELKRQYGFEIDAIREAIKAHHDKR